MLTSSSKYLALRESAYRLVIDPSISNEERFQILSQLQDEYSKPDETYSRYFSLNYFSLNRDYFSTAPSLGRWWDQYRAHLAAEDDISLLYRKMKERRLTDEPKKAKVAKNSFSLRRRR